MRRWLLALPVFVAGCSFLLDFDDVNGLPCPCDPNHVCLVPSDSCFPRHTVDDFKSCDLGAERPDDLCTENSICERVNGQGLRCLPTCSVSNFATPEAGISIKNQCPTGTSCWTSERGVGVCSEGICSDQPNDCPAPERCVRFNGAGVCFVPCNIFQTSPPPCGGTDLCHLIGDSEVTACIASGPAQIGEPCTDMEMCTQFDPQGRPLVCARPEGSGDIRRCRAVCECPAGGVCDASRCNTGAACVIVRARVDPQTQSGLGVCLE